MSVNRYNASTGELENIASGQRTWVGTQAAYKAAKQAGTLPNNAIIAITDDEVDHNHYSTDEVETGMYWIDGKPIYRKVILTPSFQQTLITDVESIIDLKVWRQYDNRAQFLVWAEGTAINMNMITANLSNGEFSITPVSSSVSNYIKYVIVEYTKTTD